MLGLRLAAGLDRNDHAPRVWSAVERRYAAAFDRAVATGRLERTPCGVRILRAHAFLADDVIAWIEARAARSAETGASDRAAEIPVVALPVDRASATDRLHDRFTFSSPPV